MKYLKLFIVILVSLTANICYAGSEFGEEIFLSDSPPSIHKEGHKHRSGDGHSEHRASPVKTFYFNTRSVSENAQVFIMRPDGSIVNGQLKRIDDNLSLTVDTRPMGASTDGIFNVYAVDRKVNDGSLSIKVAKLNVINHSCGWGHKYKHDSERLRPKSLDSIPLEIVASPLWDSNFHSTTMSGDTVKFTVLHNGKPAEGARIKVKTQTGWIKVFKADRDGNFSVQLIRDYYPEKWSNFNRSKKGTFLITAEYEIDEKGEFQGGKYERVKMISTFPWRYQPQRREYTSYSYGLSIAAIFAIAAGLGVYMHRERRKRPYKEVNFNERD